MTDEELEKRARDFVAALENGDSDAASALVALLRRVRDDAVALSIRDAVERDAQAAELAEAVRLPLEAEPNKST